MIYLRELLDDTLLSWCVGMLCVLLLRSPCIGNSLAGRRFQVCPQRRYGPLGLIAEPAIAPGILTDRGESALYEARDKGRHIVVAA